MNRYQIECRRLGESRQLLFQRQMVAYEEKRTQVDIAKARNAMAKAKEMAEREVDMRPHRFWLKTGITDPVNGAEDWRES